MGGAGKSLPELADDLRLALARPCCLRRPDFVFSGFVWTHPSPSEADGAGKSLPELADDLFLIWLTPARPCCLDRPGVVFSGFFRAPHVSS